MSDIQSPPFERILRECARVAPAAWYPADFAREQGINREDLDPYLDRLRLSGLIHLTDWVQGRGQGYALTPAGTEVLENPRRLARLQEGQLPTSNDQRPVPPPRSQHATNSWERGEAAREAFLTPAVPWVTLTLIALNVLWFLAGLVLAQRAGVSARVYFAQSTNDVLIQTGAMNGAYFYGFHQWWRLLTCAFVHIGIMHLAVNMVSLYWVGPFLERVWGHTRYLALYVVAIIGGSCGMLIEAMLGRHDTLAAGASGAIWGIFASLGTWLFLNRRALPPQMVRSLTQALVINLVLNLGLTFGIHGISKGGHFGGGIVGILVAVPLDYAIFVYGWRRSLSVAGVLIVPAVSLGVMVWMLHGPGGAVFEREAIAQELQTFRATYGGPINQTFQEVANASSSADNLLKQRQVDADDAATVLRQLDAARQDVAALIDQLNQATFRTTGMQQFLGTTVDLFQQFRRTLELHGKALTLAERPPGNQEAAKERASTESEIKAQKQQLEQVQTQWGHQLGQLEGIEAE